MTKTQEESDFKSYLKLSQLYTALREHLDDRYINEILNRQGDINYQIPTGKTRLPNSSGNTALFFALQKRNIKAFNLLINRGANFTIKNDDGSTVLHQILEDKHKKYMDNCELKGKVEDSFIDSILLSQVQFKIHENPCNKHDVSHFHAACMTNDTRAVKFFLNNGVSVDQAISINSPIFPGYTGLHFASRFCCLKTAEILLENNANMHVKDAKGMTSLDLLLERNIRIMFLNMEKRGAHVNLLTDVSINEKIINLLLENDNSHRILHLSKFHVACAMRDALLTKRFLKHVTDIDQPISKNSAVAPGCSALHLSALFSKDTLKLLLSRGANIKIMDVNGTTPLDICLEKYKVDDICDILECQTGWNELLMSDGKTKLLDLLFAMRSSIDFNRFLKNFNDIDAFVSSDSPLWPNYTALHLVITLYNKTKNLCSKRTYFHVMKDCLSKGADVTAEKVYGHTIIHFAFNLKEMDIVNLLFQYHKMIVNPIDENGWSHLHIACTAMNESTLEKLIANGADLKTSVKNGFKIHNICIPSGSTALHIAVAVDSLSIINFLLKQTADIYAKDADGMTTIHRSLLTSNNQSCAGQILLNAPNLKKCLVDGLGHLHVACFFNCTSAVKKLLHLGANINAVIANSVASEYVGLTPLHIAIRKGHWELAKLLVQYGASVTNDILFDAFKDKYGPYQDPFISTIKRDNTIMKDFNLLHIACKKVDVDLVKRTLSRGIDVNERTKDGYTALHLLMLEANDFMYDHCRQIDINVILKLLLDNGADVSLMNDAMQTPLLMADKLFYVYMDQPSDSSCGLRVDLMLKSIRDFNVNPVDADGISHFHIACSWNNFNIVEEFLNSGVDVNRTTDFFADQYAGCTALHLTLSSQTKSFTGIAAQLKTVEILLKNGANVTAEDARGNTPLHTAAKYGPPREILFKMIVRAGADINAKNIYGETPLENLLKSKDVTAEEIGFFLNNGCRVNDFNPVSQRGYIPMTFSTRHHETVQKLVFDAMINSPNINELDDTGCTAIHNVVSTGSPIITDDDYVELIEKLIKLGCDIDYQDKLGKTALHIAAQFQNDRAISGLLSAGADINVIDAKGKPAFAYSLEPCRVFDEYREGRDEIIKRTFAIHVHKLQLGKLDVSPLNKNVQVTVVKKKSFDASMNERFYKEIEKMKDIKISTHSFLHDFMSETGAVIDYPHMSFVEREAIDDFFESSRTNLTERFSELSDLLRLQYRKALARFSLIETAKDSLTRLTGIPLPDPCSEAIFVFLRNSELKTLIESSVLSLEMTK